MREGPWVLASVRTLSEPNPLSSKGRKGMCRDGSLKTFTKVRNTSTQQAKRFCTAPKEKTTVSLLPEHSCLDLPCLT